MINKNGKLCRRKERGRHSVQSMHLKICVVTQAIPITPGITFLAVVVLSIQKPVFVVDCLVQTYPRPTVGTVNIFNFLFFHDGVSTKMKMQLIHHFFYVL
jgi:late competence protein required for DNA uptake (superfamily II DNA/RNA helicase)